jgi:hypothetical protein
MQQNHTLTILASQLKAEAPALATRIERAMQIVQSGGVTKLGSAYAVASQSEPGVKYAVYFDLNWHCCCQDHTGDGRHPAPVVPFGGGVQPVCKHIAAALITWSLGSVAQPQAAPALEGDGRNYLDIRRLVVSQAVL